MLLCCSGSWPWALLLTTKLGALKPFKKAATRDFCMSLAPFLPVVQRESPGWSPEHIPHAVGPLAPHLQDLSSGSGARPGHPALAAPVWPPCHPLSGELIVPLAPEWRVLWDFPPVPLLCHTCSTQEPPTSCPCPYGGAIVCGSVSFFLPLKLFLIKNKSSCIWQKFHATLCGDVVRSCMSIPRTATSLFSCIFCGLLPMCPCLLGSGGCFPMSGLFWV